MITEEKKRLLDFFARGRKLYKLMQFEDALTYFRQALDIDPEDGPAKVYVARCRHYVDNPPPEDWDGVFVMTSK